MTHKDYPNYSRWVNGMDCRVWEKRDWGWKFIGVAKSHHPIHGMEIISTDADHPDDVFHEEVVNEWLR